MNDSILHRAISWLSRPAWRRRTAVTGAAFLTAGSLTAWQVAGADGGAMPGAPPAVAHADAPADAERLLAWGADGLITDRPDVIVPLVRDSRRLDAAR